MWRFIKRLTALLSCACILAMAVFSSGCKPTAESNQPESELQIVREAWKDFVAEQSFSVNCIAIHSSPFSSFLSVLQQPENIAAVLNICKKLDVSVTEGGSPSPDIIGNAATITLYTDHADPAADRLVLYITTDGSFAISLQMDQGTYNVHGKSHTLKKDGFSEFFQFTEKTA